MDGTLCHPISVHVISSSCYSSPSLLISSPFISFHPVSSHIISSFLICLCLSLFIPSHPFPFQFQRELIKEEREETEEAKQVRLTYLAAQEPSTKLLAEPPAIAQIGAYVFYLVCQSVLAYFLLEQTLLLCVRVCVCAFLVLCLSEYLFVRVCVCVWCIVSCHLSLCRSALDNLHRSLRFTLFISSLYSLSDNPDNSNELMKSTQNLPRQLPA